MTKRKGGQKKAAKAGNKSVGRREKGATSVSYNSGKDTYRIRCTYYPRKGEAGQERVANGYKTEAQAMAEEALFAFAVRNGGARKWENWDPAETDRVNKKRNKAYSVSFSKQSSNASNPTENKGATVLNATEKKKLQRMRREGTTTLSRFTFTAFLAQSKEDMERGIIAMQSEKVEKRMSQKYSDHARYTTQRLALLADLIANEKKKSALLLKWIAAGKTTALMIRADEKTPRPVQTIKWGDFSEKQTTHVFNQALATHSCTEKRIERLETERLLIQQWKTAADGVVEVGEKEALLKSLTEKLDELKISRSTLKLVTEVCQETTLFVFKPATILSWWQEFNTLGGVGFREDGRGKSAKYNWLEDWGLTSTLGLYLSTEKKISVSAVQDFLNAKVKELYDASPQKYETEVEVNGEKKSVLQKKLRCNRDAVHRFMLLAGAKWCVIKKSYYNDRHEDPDNVADRGNRFLPKKEELARREAVWAVTPYSTLLGPALAYTLRAYALTGKDDPLPLIRDGRLQLIKKGEELEGDKIQVHVNFISDKDGAYLRYRRGRYTATGEAGDYLFERGTDGRFVIPNDLSDLLRFNLLQCTSAHDTASCRCMFPLFSLGQDESIYNAYAEPKCDWVINGQQKLRKKTEGQGIMVTVMVSDKGIGLGKKLTTSDLIIINAFRARNGKEPLTQDPSFILFEYGQHKQGYWNSDMFCKQITDVLDCLEHLWPNSQFCIEVDHSSGHTKKREDGLCAVRMNKDWGGKQPEMHETEIKQGCLGDNQVPRYAVGDIQSLVFLPTDSPPFYDPTATAHDRHDDQLTKKEKEAIDKRRLAAENLRKESDPPVDIPYVAVGYAGKPKGWRQILWERGLYKPGMRNSRSLKEEKLEAIKNPSYVPDMTLYGDVVLASCPDFREEKSALEELISSRGHILLLGVKCHPEMAGHGIEYCFGCSKRYFRKHNNCVTRNLQQNVIASFAEEVLSLERCWKFDRRAWQYQQMYRELAESGEVISYSFLEKTMREKKVTHRNILEIESRFLREVEVREQEAVEMGYECL